MEQLTEKYRPRRLEEIVGNAEVMECMRSFTADSMPNMLFYGPPGTGKTTTIRALLRDFPRQNILELNASDHRGIDTVREQIKEFASMKSERLKVVVLDEADSMSKDAQGALRRVIEDFRGTRFCFICNFYKKMIEPIVSRCTRFRFAPVNEASRIKEVCLREGIEHDDDGVELLSQYSDGDMRKVMNDIQGLRSSHGRIDRKNVLEFFGLCEDGAFEDIFESLRRDSFDVCRRRIASEDVDCTVLIRKMTAMLAESCMEKKMEILRQLAEIECRISQGCTEIVQLNAIVGAFILNR